MSLFFFICNCLLVFVLWILLLNIENMDLVCNGYWDIVVGLWCIVGCEILFEGGWF